MITTKAHSNNAHLSCSSLLSLYSLVQHRGENRNVWLYCIEPARGVCQSMHATQWAWRDWCFCHPPASKLWKKRKSSRLMQVEKASRQAHKQKRENLTAPRFALFLNFNLRFVWWFTVGSNQLWVLCPDWVSAECLFPFSFLNGNNLIYAPFSPSVAKGAAAASLPSLVFLPFFLFLCLLLLVHGEQMCGAFNSIWGCKRREKERREKNKGAKL